MQPFCLGFITVGTDCAVLQVGGEVDVYTAPQLRQRVIDLIEAGARHIIVDLREVDFLDSTGLGALVGSRNRLRGHGGSLTLVTDTDKIRRLLRLTGLLRVFPLRNSILEALAADRDWNAALTSECLSAEQWCRNNGLR